MKIHCEYEEEVLVSFLIDEEEYLNGEDRPIIPVSILKKIELDDLPYDVEIEICESKNDNHIVVDAPAYFKRIGEKKFYVRYEEVIPRKYWDGPIGLKLYMETKRNMVFCQDLVQVKMRNFPILTCHQLRFPVGSFI